MYSPAHCCHSCTLRNKHIRPVTPSFSTICRTLRWTTSKSPQTRSTWRREPAETRTATLASCWCTFLEARSSPKSPANRSHYRIVEKRSPIENVVAAREVNLRDSSNDCCAGNDFAVQHRRFLDSIRRCCAGNDFAVQHRRFLDSIRRCCAGNDFAVQHRRFLDSIGVSCLASAVAAQETIFLSSIRGSYYSIFDSLPGKARRAAITTNKALHFNHLRLKHSGFDRFPDRFVFHQFQIFLLLQRGAAKARPRQLWGR